MATDAERDRLTALARAYGLLPSDPGTWALRQAPIGGEMPSTKPKGSGSSKGLSPAERAKMEWEAVKRRWEVQDRAAKIAEAEAERAAEVAAAEEERRREYETATALAELIGQQGAEAYKQDVSRIGQMFGPQAERIAAGREADLSALRRSVAAGGEQITGAEQEFLQGLLGPTAYSDVPLVELQTPENVLLRGLLAEGASTAGVEEQRAMDQRLLNQLAALQRSAGQQLNVAGQNYLRALQQAGRGAGAAARQQLGLLAPQYEQQIMSRYGDLESQLLQSRLEAEARAEEARRAAELERAKYQQAAKGSGYQPPVVPNVPQKPPTGGGAAQPEAPILRLPPTPFVNPVMGVTGEAEKAARDAGAITEDQMIELIRRRSGF